MPETSSEGVATPHAKFPGMRVVAGGFLVLTTSAGLGFYGLAVYLNALSKERGWDIASLSFGTTVFFVVAGVTGLWVARFIARRDARLAVLGGGIIGAGSLLALGQITAVWQLYVVYCLYGVGFAAAGLVTVTTVVTRSSSDGNFSGVHGSIGWWRAHHPCCEMVCRRADVAGCGAVARIGLFRWHGGAWLVFTEERPC